MLAARSRALAQLSVRRACCVMPASSPSSILRGTRLLSRVRAPPCLLMPQTTQLSGLCLPTGHLGQCCRPSRRRCSSSRRMARASPRRIRHLPRQRTLGRRWLAEAPSTEGAAAEQQLLFAADQLGSSSALATLYAWHPLLDFVRAALSDHTCTICRSDGFLLCQHLPRG